jgi:hypothetical protein
MGFLRTSCVLFAVVAGADRAAATPVFYDFSIDVVSGPLVGDTLAGSFSIDDSVLTGTDFLFNLFQPLGVLESFSLSFGGFDFDTSNAAMTLLSIIDGEIDRFLLTGAPSGYNRITSTDGLADFSIISDEECGATSTLNCPFSYDLPTSTIFQGTFDFERRADIVAMSEPWSVAVFGAGLALLGVMSYRPSRRHAAFANASSRKRSR